MNTKTYYKYEMENGGTAILTSKVTSCQTLLSIEASEGKILTDGEKKAYSFYVTEDTLKNYYEVDDEESVYEE